MRGIIYKELVTGKSGMFCTGAISGMIWLILLAVNLYSDTVGSTGNISDNTQGITILACVLNFFFISIFLPELFRADENKKLWLNFAAASPQKLSGHLTVKYILMLALNVAALLGWFIFGGIIAAANGKSLDVLGDCFTVFCMFLFIFAFETPFIVRFGMDKGMTIKMFSLGVVAFIAIVYALFGDISFITDGLTPESIAAFLSGDTIKTFKIIMPITALVGLTVSWLISMMLYRKGAENYED